MAGARNWSNAGCNVDIYSGVAELEQERCIVMSTENGCEKENLTVDWLKLVIGISSFACLLLTWDPFECHMTPQIKGTVRSFSTKK